MKLSAFFCAFLACALPMSVHAESAQQVAWTHVAGPALSTPSHARGSSHPDLVTVQAPQVRDPATVPIQQLLNDPNQIWVGRLKCARGLRTDEDILLRGVPAEGRFNVFLMAFPHNMRGDMRRSHFVGEMNADGSFLFAQSKQVRSTLGIGKTSSFTMTVARGNILTVQVSDDRCDAVTLTPRSPYFHHAFARVRIATGTYFAARDITQRCLALAEWAKPMAAYTQSREINEKIATLYYDDAFVPTFGLPYDALNIELLVKIWQEDMEYGRTCTKDPILKTKMGRTLDYMRGWFGFQLRRRSTQNPQINFNASHFFKTYLVQENRLAWGEVQRKAEQIVQIGANPKIFAELEALEAILENRSDLIPAKDIEEAGGWIKNVREQSAFQLAQVAQQNLLSVSGPASERLGSIRAFDTRPPAYFAFLESDLRAAFKKERASHIKALSKLILDDVAKETLAFPVTTDGIKAMNAAIEQKIAARSDLDKATKNAKMKELSAERDTRLATLIKDEAAKIDALPQDTQGLRAGQKWLEGFTQSFADFKSSTLFAEAVDAYWERREALLEALLPEFEERVAELKTNEQIDKLLKLYLPTEEDTKLLVSLEYEFVAESAKN